MKSYLPLKEHYQKSLFMFQKIKNIFTSETNFEGEFTFDDVINFYSSQGMNMAPGVSEKEI